MGRKGGEGTWSGDLVHEHFTERLNRLEDALQHRFDGFPQEYGTRAEVDGLRTVLEELRSDHVLRRELDSVEEGLEKAVDSIQGQLHEQQGRRAATNVWLAVILAVLGPIIVIMWSFTPSSAEITQQIQTEAPWLEDRPDVMRRLRALEDENTALRIRLNDIQNLTGFLCRTRTPTLPPCP